MMPDGGKLLGWKLKTGTSLSSVCLVDTALENASSLAAPAHRIRRARIIDVSRQ
jgi:hypothetical protein